MKYLILPALVFLAYLNSKQRGSFSKTIELYVLPGCPYCQKVKDFLDQNNISYITHDVSNKNVHKEMMRRRHNNKTSVPFAIIDGKPIDESDQIIAVLQKMK